MNRLHCNNLLSFQHSTMTSFNFSGQLLGILSLFPCNTTCCTSFLEYDSSFQGTCRVTNSQTTTPNEKTSPFSFLSVVRLMSRYSGAAQSKVPIVSWIVLLLCSFVLASPKSVIFAVRLLSSLYISGCHDFVVYQNVWALQISMNNFRNSRMQVVHSQRNFVENSVYYRILNACSECVVLSFFIATGSLYYSPLYTLPNEPLPISWFLNICNWLKFIK